MSSRQVVREMPGGMQGGMQGQGGMGRQI